MNCAEMMETGYNVMLPQAGMDVTAGYAGATAQPPSSTHSTLL